MICLLHSITPVGFKLCHRPSFYGLDGGVGFFVNHNIQLKIVESPTYMSFDSIVIVIGSSAGPFVIACVYRPSASSSDAWFDQFFILFECLSSVSSSFFMCGNFNIHADTTSNDSAKFQNCLESCNSQSANPHTNLPLWTHP